MALAAIVKRSGCNTALPLLLRLTPQAGNSGKLVIARSLIRALLEPLKDKAVTVLYKQPWQHKGRGRPRKYGTRYTKEEIKRLPLNKETIHLYGREQQWLKPAFLMASSYALSGVSLRTLKGKNDHAYYCQPIRS